MKKDTVPPGTAEAALKAKAGTENLQSGRAETVVGSLQPEAPESVMKKTQTKKQERIMETNPATRAEEVAEIRRAESAGTAAETLSSAAYRRQYADYKELVEKALRTSLRKVDPHAAILYEAMEYSLLAGGKRLRPVLLLAAAAFCGGRPEEALPFACAIEQIHTYSLIHDDHPSLDNDDLRRGKPTSHIVFGADIALLAGDALLNSAMEGMMEAAWKAERPELSLRAALEIARAAGTGGMIAGQTADVLMTGSAVRNMETEHQKAVSCEDTEEGWLLYIHRNKTGALIRAAVRAGAILGGASEAQLEHLTEFAEKLGLTFQIVDDILDVTGDAEQLGKHPGADRELGKLTYPALFGLEGSRHRAERATAEAIRALQQADGGAAFLTALAEDFLNRIS